MVSFIQLIVIYTLAETGILLFCISRSRGQIDAVNAKYHIGKYLFAFALTAYILPHAYLLFINRFAYPDPDTYGIITSIEKNLPWQQMPIDAYYQNFPIYVILGKTIGLITDLKSHEALVVTQLASVILMLVCLGVSIRKLSPYSKKGDFLFALYPLVIVSTIYLYGYTEIMIPQILGIAILAMLIMVAIKVLNTNSLSSLVTYIVILPISLVHFGVIPTYILTFIPTILSLAVTRKIHGYTTLVIVPAIISLLYVFFAYNPTNPAQYVKYYAQLLNGLFNPAELSSLISGSASAGFLRTIPYINAFGPAAFLSLSLTGFWMLFKRIIKPRLILASSLSIGVIYLALGFSRLYIFTQIPSASIARYVNVYGLLLLGLFSIYVLKNLDERSSKLIKICVVVILALGFVGSLADPFAFQARPSQGQVADFKTIASLFQNEISLRFTSVNDWYYQSPAVTLWATIDNKTIISSTVAGSLPSNPSLVFDSGLTEILYNSGVIYLTG